MPDRLPPLLPSPQALAPTWANLCGGLVTELATNVLSYVDNLDILRRYLPDAAIDLVYLDPPFNRNRD
jgi:16S rRNA G966 N2-methylase RsmD